MLFLLPEGPGSGLGLLLFHLLVRCTEGSGDPQGSSPHALPARMKKTACWSRPGLSNVQKLPAGCLCLAPNSRAESQGAVHSRHSLKEHSLDLGQPCHGTFHGAFSWGCVEKAKVDEETSWCLMGQT